MVAPVALWIWMDSVAVLCQQWLVLPHQPTIYWQRRATAAVQIKTNCETINLDLKPPPTNRNTLICVGKYFPLSCLSYCSFSSTTIHSL